MVEPQVEARSGAAALDEHYARAVHRQVGIVNLKDTFVRASLLAAVVLMRRQEKH